MKSKIILFSAAILIAFASTQCKKKKTEESLPEPTPEQPVTGINSLTELFSTNGAPTETFVVNSTGAQTITTAAGVKVEIPANVFVTSTNGTLTGNVTVAVRTILTKKEIILSGAQANSSNSKLVSTKGCVKITASQNSQSLRLNGSSNGTVNVSVPDGIATPPPMKKYYVSKLSVTDSTKYWKMENDTNDVSVFWNGTNYMQKAVLDSLKWLNIGKQWDSTCTKVVQYAHIDSTQFNLSNCVVYLSYNNSLTAGAMYPIPNTGLYKLSNMPLGKGVHIIAIAVKNGQYYEAINNTTVKPTTESLILQPKSLSQIIADLNALP